MARRGRVGDTLAGVASALEVACVCACCGANHLGGSASCMGGGRKGGCRMQGDRPQAARRLAVGHWHPWCASSTSLHA